VPDDAEEVLRGACPVVASYGKRDLPLRSAPAKLERALQANGVPHDVKTYDGVGHSFMNRHGPAPVNVLEKVVGFHYDDAAAEDAWARILRFFAVHLA
jgi:carboxymethylenebutenolidase